MVTWKHSLAHRPSKHPHMETLCWNSFVQVTVIPTHQIDTDTRLASWGGGGVGGLFLGRETLHG